MIHNTCPCCEVPRLPHRDGCTLHSDAPSDAEDFDYVSALRDEIDRLRDERRWIPVWDRLPENAERVWAFVPGSYGPQEAQWVDDHWRDHFGRVRRPVTHWMPLPPGPEGDG